MVDDASFMSSMVVLLAAMTAITSFSYDKQAGWEEYALSLPLPRKTIVKSKYVLSFLFALAGMALSVLLGIVINVVKKSGIEEHLVSTYVLFAISILFLCIMLPLIFKFGVEKSRIFMIIVLAIPTAAVFALDRAGFKLPNEELLGRILIYSPLMLAALYVFSYMLSRCIFEKKEL
jgi:ABC-type transport system involved in multi-copper enzyme maturation permease subunit